MNLSKLQIKFGGGGYWLHDETYDFPWPSLDAVKYDLQEECLGYRTDGTFPYCKTKEDAWKLAEYYNSFSGDVVVIKLSGREVAAWNGELLAFNCAVTPEQIYDILKMLNL